MSVKISVNPDVKLNKEEEEFFSEMNKKFEEAYKTINFKVKLYPNTEREEIISGKVGEIQKRILTESLIHGQCPYIII